MRYDDLLGIPYVHHGRGKDGLDCYGAVIECCARAGTPLRDYAVLELADGELAHLIDEGLNVRRIDTARKGAIAYFVYAGRIHVGYMVERDLVLHATRRGVRVTHIGAMKAVEYYEVVSTVHNVQRSTTDAH